MMDQLAILIAALSLGLFALTAVLWAWDRWGSKR